MISLSEKKIIPTGKLGELLLKRLSYLIYPIFLWYLLRAEERELTEDFLSYRSLRGGETFFRGSHELPLSRLAEKFEKEPENLYQSALLLGGESFSIGEQSFKFLPLPRVPVVVTFWRGEEGIPASANFLFESQTQEYLPLDLLWAIAMYVCQVLLISPGEIGFNKDFNERVKPFSD